MLDIWENSLRKVKLHWEANFTTQTPAQVDQRLMISSKKCMGFFLDLFQNTVVDELWICPGWIVNAKVLAQHSKLYNTALHRVHTWNVTFQPYVWAFAWVHRAVQHWTDYLAVLYSIMCNCALYRFIREATRGEIVIKCGECRGGDLLGGTGRTSATPSKTSEDIYSPMTSLLKSDHPTLPGPVGRGGGSGKPLLDCC